MNPDPPFAPSGPGCLVDEIPRDAEAAMRFALVLDVHHVPAPLLRQELHPERGVDVVIGEVLVAERPRVAGARRAEAVMSLLAAAGVGDLALRDHALAARAPGDLERPSLVVLEDLEVVAVGD